MGPVDEIERESRAVAGREAGTLDAQHEEDAEQYVKKSDAQEDRPGGSFGLLRLNGEAGCEMTGVHYRLRARSSQARMGTGSAKLIRHRSPKPKVVMGCVQIFRKSLRRYI